MMSSSQLNLRSILAVTAAFSAGAATCLLATQLHTPAIVHAESRSAAVDGPLDFQLSSMSQTSALTIYSPAQHTLYVYPAVSGGSSEVNCSFTLSIEKLGGPIKRRNCGIGEIHP